MKRKHPWIIGITLALLFSFSSLLVMDEGTPMQMPASIITSDTTDYTFPGDPGVECDNSIMGCNNADDNNRDYREHTFFNSFLGKVINWIMVIAAGGSVLMIVVAGVMFLYAGGKEDLMDKAKKTLIFALAGLFVSMFAYLIVEVVSRLSYVAPAQG